MTIPVICDRCRVAGTAGTGDFAHFGDLLDFVPVKRRYRVNGWDPDAQRAFIALLATTGSKRRAAMAIGRNAFGIDQLLKAKDADSFRAAYDRAMAIARQNGAMKLASGVADGAARNAILAPPSRLRGLPAPLPSAGEGLGRGGDSADPPQPMTEDQALDLLESIFGKYLAKLQAERKARLEGDVVAADFYLRQASWFEVALDLGCEHQGIDVVDWLAGLRRDGRHLVDIARTPLSRFMDEARRLLWTGDFDEPERPDPTDEELFEDFPGYSLQPIRHIPPGPDEAELRARLEERQRAAAAKQVEWEASRAVSPGD